MKKMTFLSLASLSFTAISVSLGKAPTPVFAIDETPPVRAGALGGYAQVVEKVSPSVVSITTIKNVRAPQMRAYEFRDPFTGQLFQRRQMVPGDVVPQPHGNGSGVVLSADGYVVTNAHVVGKADGIKVAIGEDDLFDATLVGKDLATDVAVLKIDASGLNPIEFGASNKLLPGDFVLALGSPFGLPQTVTSGIVSGLGRTDLGITGASGYEDFIQTDASINPGNSGGALVDNRGRMVGMNTAIFSRSGGSLGIGFAIPSELVVSVAEQLIRYGEVRRGLLGVALGDLTQDLAKALRVDGQGALVHEVVEGSAAETYGVKPGDVIYQFNSRPVGGASKLRVMAGVLSPGQPFKIELIREGEKVVVEGKMGPADLVPGADLLSRIFQGATLQDMSASGVNGSRKRGLQQGILIDSVEPGSKAARYGLRSGEVIVEVGRVEVNNLFELEARIQELLLEKGSELILLRVRSQNASRLIALKLG